MESWKIGVIAAMLAGLVGFGLYNQSVQTQVGVNNSGTPVPSPTPLRYVGMSIVSTDLPEWANVTQWANTPAPITLGSLKGKVALIEIFRTECSHCQDAAPFMEALYDRYKSRGLQIVAIQSPGDFKDAQNPENDWKAVQKWITTRGLKYPVGFDGQSAWFQGKVSGKPEQKLYPTLLLTDKTGKIQFGQTGHDEGKAISLAVAIEKALPSSGTIEERAADLGKWLSGMLQSMSDGAMQKALVDDIAERLKAE